MNGRKNETVGCVLGVFKAKLPHGGIANPLWYNSSHVFA